MSWRRSSAINYGADVPSCAWNFDWHDVRVPTAGQQGLACGSKCVMRWKYKLETNYNVFEWFRFFHDAFIALMENSCDVCHFRSDNWSTSLCLKSWICKLVFSVGDAWFPIFSASAFQTLADKCMLMCWRDLKSEMRQPILSDQSCVTKPEPRLSPLFLHGGPGWPQ